MNICIVGDFSSPSDEGYKKVASELARELAKANKITKLNIKTILSREQWIRIQREPEPHVIHYVTAPTLRSLLLLRFLQSCWHRKPKTVVSALYTELTPMAQILVKVFRLQPDLVLVQSQEDANLFSRLGCEIAFLPNGVDIDKFIPRGESFRKEMKQRYRIDPDKFVLLHVGHLKEDRNLKILNGIANKQVQALVVASEYVEVDRKIMKDLETHGQKILLGYLENIEEIYAMSDCYFFPVLKDCSISMPLSVLEALSCNLPVVARRFEGLAHFLREGDGFYLAETDDELLARVNDTIEMVSNRASTRTREKVIDCSWERVSRTLEEIYSKMLQSDPRRRK